MSVLTYKRYARLSLRKYRKSFGWPVVDNFLAIIYTCGPAWVIRITFSLIPVLVLTSDVSNESPPTVFPLAFNYDSQVSLVREIWRRCLSSGKQRRDDSNFLDKSGSQIPGNGIVSIDSVRSSGFINRFRTYDRCLKFAVWYLERNLSGKKIKRKILFHLELLKTFFYFFVDKIRIITKKEENIPNFNN